MSVRAYQVLRVLAGAAVLLGCAAAFADVRDWIGSQVAGVVVWPQFLPSLLAWLHGAGWAAAGFAAVLVLTLLFGRVYCAMLCPLGVLMDWAAWLAGRRGRRRRLPYRRGRPWLRLGVVVVTGGAAAAGSAVLLGLLDPFSLFGRGVAHSLRPLAGWGINQAATAGWLNPAEVSPSPPLAVGVGLGLLVLVVGLAVARGRLWCNTLCPVGAVLGAVSRFSLFRLRIGKAECIGCSMCERTCPAQCIDYRKREIDNSRCVMCLECVSSCRKSGINLEPAWRASAAPAGVPVAAAAPAAEPAAPAVPAVAAPLARRGFFAGLAASAAAATATTPPGVRKLTPATKLAVLPPGALGLRHFQRTCTGCQLCVANCPEQVLRPAIREHGLAGFLQPYQDFAVSFCSYNCSNCSQICPTGAIQPISVEERQGIQTGIAVFFTERCIVETEGTSCGACSEHCPTQAVHMVPFRDNLTIPVVTPELCVGCGGCEYICPVIPDKAIVVDGLAVHAAARRIELGGENVVREIEEEFPF
jgi:ferredoxin